MGISTGRAIQSFSWGGPSLSAWPYRRTCPCTRTASWSSSSRRPSGSGNKLKFDDELGIYRLDRVLLAGMTFPFDFGFIPETVADDGDPLDVAPLRSTAPVHPGCVVLARLVGILEAEKGQGSSQAGSAMTAWLRWPEGLRPHASIGSLDDVDPFRLQAIESFFEDYHALDGDRFRVNKRGGVEAAEAAIRRAHEAFQAKPA